MILMSLIDWEQESPQASRLDDTDPGGAVRRLGQRIRKLSLHEALRLLPYTTGLTAVFSVGLVQVTVWQRPAFQHSRAVIDLAIAALAIALTLRWLFDRPTRSATSVTARATASWVLAVQLGVVFLVGPVLLLTVNTAFDNITGWTFPVLNKRWLVGLYDLAIVTFVVFPAALERWRADPAAAENVRPFERPTARGSWMATTIGIIGIVAACWYFAGPPWNLDRLHREIDWHEQLHLGPLQAISKGYLPYIGPASTVYGPGSQLLTYATMRVGRRFDLVSFRTAFAVFNFAAVLAIGIAACKWLGFGSALAVLLLALAYSPAAFYYMVGDGTFTGFFGWANPLRYLAPLIVVPSLVRVAYESREGPSDEKWLVMLGIAWGIGAWLAQENLSMTAVAGGLLLTLLWLTRTITLSTATRILSYLVLGFACVALPVLLFYGIQGAAGTFVHNYFLNPRAVAMGFSNMWWPDQNATLPERYSYYLTLPFLVALALCTLWQLRPLRLAGPLEYRRALFLAFICVQLVCYQTSLFRSDSSHVRNTMIALPFVLVMAFRDLPQWLAGSRWRRMAIRGLVVMLSLAIYPTLKTHPWELMLTKPMTRFSASPSPPARIPYDGRVAFKRATGLLRDEPVLAANSGLSMREFLTFASELHDIVGQRKTYIAYIGNVYTGLIYFMADLMPAPYPLDLETMTINADLRGLVIEHMRAHPEDYECFIGPSLEATEAQVFLAGHSGAVTLPWKLGPSPLYVLLAPKPQ